MSRLDRIRPHEMSEAQRDLHEQITGGVRAKGPQHFPLTNPDGSLRGPFNAFLLSPDLGRPLQELGGAIRYAGTLPDRAREIAILLVAAAWESEFERDSHEAVGRAAGLTEAELTALRRCDPSAFEGDERLIAEVVIQLNEGDLDDELWRRARAALGEEIVFELSVLVGYYTMLALQLRVFRAND